MRSIHIPDRSIWGDRVMKIATPRRGAPMWAVITYPWGSWIVGRMMLHAASDLKHRRPIRWGGREYVLEERE